MCAQVYKYTQLCTDRMQRRRMTRYFLAKSNKIALIYKKSTGFLILSLFYRIHALIYLTIYVYKYAQLCTDRMQRRRMTRYFLAKSNKIALQKIDRLSHIKFVLPNSFINILDHIISLKFEILFCDCVFLHFLRALSFSFII